MFKIALMFNIIRLIVSFCTLIFLNGCIYQSACKIPECPVTGSQEQAGVGPRVSLGVTAPTVRSGREPRTVDSANVRF